MKGVVFVKLNEFIEETFGLQMWEDLLEEASLPSGGIYTSVATYDDQELFDLVSILSAKTGIHSDAAQKAFGEWVFKELYASAPPGVHQFTDVFTFLRAVQDVIHVEVKKLNPDVLLPEFVFLDETPTTLTFEYISPRKMYQFCEGLIYGLAKHTQQKVDVSYELSIDMGSEKCVFKVNKVG